MVMSVRESEGQNHGRFGKILKTGRASQYPAMRRRGKLCVLEAFTKNVASLIDGNGRPGGRSPRNGATTKPDIMERKPWPS